MKLSFPAFFLCASLACAGRSRAATLPDSCGADNVNFDVKTEKPSRTYGASRRQGTDRLYRERKPNDGPW
ncbi:MAG: hypothetical protein WA197_10240, partial [Candidatus Acidiferrales bacterium]